MKFNIGINLETKNWKNKKFFDQEFQKNHKIIELLDEKKIKNLVNLLVKLTLENVLKKKNDCFEIQISFLFSNNERIQALNKEFRNQDKPTNVLAFEYVSKEDQEKLINNCASLNSCDDDGLFLGEIAISFEKTFEESKNLEINFIDHLSHLIIHGILHLLGFDHETSEEDARIMENLEIKILSQIGIQNPYSETI